MATQEIPIGADHNVWYRNMRNQDTGAAVTDATVTAVVSPNEDGSSPTISAITLTHQGSGDYLGTFAGADTGALTKGQTYWVVVTVSGTAVDKRSIRHVAKYRRVSP